MVTKILESFLDGKVKIYQNDLGYKSGMDAVLLASIIEAKPKDKILELGMGVGVVSLCLVSRLSNVTIFGIEKNQYFYQLAVENIQNNNCEDKVKAKHSNILDEHKELINSFNVVMCNPPYYNDSTNINNHDLKTSANVEQDAKLADFIASGFRFLKNQGYFYMIMTSSRLKEALDLFSIKHWGGIEIFPIYSYENKAAKRFIVKVRKLSLGVSKLHYGIVIHNVDGSYTKRAEDILRNGNNFFGNNFDNIDNKY